MTAFASPAAADERILRYLSDVQVRQDGSLDVTEMIRVRAENDRINHGIFRDFPTRYRGSHGERVSVGFRFEGATLDGAAAQATTEPLGNGVRIKIGDPDTTVPVGEHDYVIRYSTTRQIGRFSGYDELYWNVTGNGWAFPIDVAEARIRLPSPAPFGQRAVYTGFQGAADAFAEVVDEKPGDISFRTTRPLDAYQGLTVAVAFPKGVIAEPTGADRAAGWLRDFAPIIVALAGLLGLATFYFVAWKRAGRDPRAGTIVPIFAPPDDLTPAALRYVTRMGSDNRAFAAALVDMGVRGHIRLSKKEGGWLSRDSTTLERLNADSPLPPEEKMALDCLCMPGETIDMRQENHAAFSSAKNGLNEVLKKTYENKLFHRNLGWAVAGALLFGGMFWLACAAIVVATADAALWQVGTVLGVFAVTALLWIAFHESATGKCLLTALTMVAGVVVMALGFPIFAQAMAVGWWLPLALPLLAVPLVVSAFWWMSAPTAEGRGVLDRIAGFKQYLSITERERLDRLTGAPADTVQLFEKYLPYAIALGVENRWADRFSNVLAAASAAGHQGFGWYAGSHSPWDNPTSFADSVGSSLASTVSSASTAPGSSSGSGGGGSSGGGGGGGGGGGW